MSLKSIDISKLNRLSIKDIELQDLTKTEEPLINSPVKTEEELTLNTEENEQRYTELRERIERNRERIERNRERIERNKREIINNQRTVRDLEETFIQATKRCQIEWYRPKWMTEVKKVNELNEFLYWTS